MIADEVVCWGRESVVIWHASYLESPLALRTAVWKGGDQVAKRSRLPTDVIVDSIPRSPPCVNVGCQRCHLKASSLRRS